MPSMTDDDDHPFDPRQTSCRALGIVPDTFWRLPGVIRSDSPHAFVAFGPAATDITAPHPADFPHGPESPVGRVHDLDGLVLLIGIGHEANTTIHLAEALAGVRYRRPKHTTVRGATGPTLVRYLEIDHCCENFRLVDSWLDASGFQRRGPIGHGTARLAASRAIVDRVTSELRADETVFLHPPGVDPQCDEARESMPSNPTGPSK